MQNHPLDPSESGVLPEEDFEYQPLPGPDYIRVLTILPSEGFADPIQCEIETAPLDKSANYIALSYSWGMDKTGDATPNRSLSIHNRTKRITQNLYEGILRLRQDPELRPLRIWIDAVCIDQGNDEERTQQVSSMRFVFQNANHTIIWLGEGDDPDANAAVLPVVQCMAEGDSSSHKNGSHIWHRADGKKHDICALNLAKRAQEAEDLEGDAAKQRYRDFESEINGDLGRELVDKAYEIMARRYFRGRWVVQELLSSSRSALRVYWGHCSCRLADLLDSLDRLKWYTLLMENCADDTEDRLYDISQILEPDEVHTLPALVSLCRKMDCSDLRDLLYCLAGLDPEFGLVPNYQITTTAAYTSFARLLLEKGHVKGIFWSAPFNRTRWLYPRVELPSWVPHPRYFVALGGARHPDSYTWQNLNLNVSEDNILTFSPFVIGKVKSAHIHKESIYTNHYSIKVTPTQIKGAVARRPSPFAQPPSSSSTLFKKLPSIRTNLRRRRGGPNPAESQQDSFTADLQFGVREEVILGDMLCSIKNDVEALDNYLCLLRPLDAVDASLLRLLKFSSAANQKRMTTIAFMYPAPYPGH